MPADPSVAVVAPAAPPERRRRHHALAALLLAIFVFLAIAPTLHWNQFHQAIENLNVATAMEMHRDHSWLVPNLQGLPRLAKPPLTAWLTALAIGPQTLSDINSGDPAVRSVAYQWLAFDVRWPTLLACCAMLLATYALGSTIGASIAPGKTATLRWQVGLIAAIACASNLIFLRHCRFATIDPHLALWSTVANLGLAQAILLKRFRWLIVAGAAMGLGFFSKGPVVLATSVLPFAVYLILRRVWEGRAELAVLNDGHELPGNPGPPQRHAWLLPAVLGLLLFVLIGFSWSVAAALKHQGALKLWSGEVSRDSDEVPAGAWYAHVLSLRNLFPWILWGLLGLWLAIADLRRRKVSGRTLALVMLVAPLIVISLFKDRYERYLLPLLPAASILIALGFQQLWNADFRRLRAAVILVAAHGLMVLGWTSGMPIVAAMGRSKDWRKMDGQPWLSWPVAICLAGGTAALLAFALWRWRRSPVLLAAVTLVCMLAAQTAYTYGRSRSIAGHADLRPAAEQVRARHPDVTIYSLRGGRTGNIIGIHANTLSIYLNRTAKWADTTEEIEKEPGPVVLARTARRGAKDWPTPAGWDLILRTEGADKKFVYLKPDTRKAN